MTDLMLDRDESPDIYEFIMLVPEEHREVIIHEIEAHS
jgi:hypothetical protein